MLKNIQIDLLFRFSRGPTCGRAPRQTWKPPHPFHNTLRKKHHFSVCSETWMLSWVWVTHLRGLLTCHLLFIQSLKFYFCLIKSRVVEGQNAFFWCAAPSWDVHTFQMVCSAAASLQISGRKSCTSIFPSSRSCFSMNQLASFKLWWKLPLKAAEEDKKKRHGRHPWAELLLKRSAQMLQFYHSWVACPHLKSTTNNTVSFSFFRGKPYSLYWLWNELI